LIRKDYIKRERYLNKTLPYAGKDVIKVFTGQRRVGKSYMMYQLADILLAQNVVNNVIYIDKEQHEFDRIKNHDDLFQYITSKKKTGKNAVFIDEIQEITDFEKALRSLYSAPGFDIYCSGSNANMLSGELATTLSGRYVEIEVFSLSFQEFLEFHKLENSNESLMDYLKFGGLPNLIQLELNERVVFDYLKNIYSTILFKDVVKRFNIRNVAFLENLVYYLSDNLGSIVSAKKISDFLKSQNIRITPNIVLDYLFYLGNAFFIYKTRRQDVIGKKIFEIGEKYYFEDTGLRNTIAGFNIQDISKIIENTVFHHLKVHGFDVHVGVSGNREIDFIAEKNNEKLYIQACYLLHEQATIDREFGNLLEIKDNFPKMVVSMDEVSGTGTYEGIQHVHLKEFLSRAPLS